MSRISVLRPQVLMQLTTIVMLLGFILDSHTARLLMQGWAICVLVHALHAVIREGWRGLGLPTLVLAGMAVFHGAQFLPLFIVTWIACLLIAGGARLAAAVWQRLQDGPRRVTQSTSNTLEPVSVVGERAANVDAQDVLARFGFGER